MTRTHSQCADLNPSELPVVIDRYALTNGRVRTVSLVGIAPGWQDDVRVPDAGFLKHTLNQTGQKMTIVYDVDPPYFVAST